jgi:PAS domain S-box-containing protein
MGQPAILSIGREISERKKIEKALIESEKKFEMAFRTSPYAITITRISDGKLIDVNDAFTTITGYSREEALNSSSVTLQLWHDEEDRNGVLRDLAAGKTVVGQEFRYRTKSGETIIGLFSGHVLMIGSEPCVLSSINIITERKKMEEALKISEEKHRALYNNAPLAYQSLDENGILLDVNPAWLEILGYERDEVIGQPFKDFLDLEMKPLFVKRFAEFKRRGHISDAQFRMVHKSGDYRDVLFEGRVGRSADGTFLQTYCVFQDISDSTRTERALRESEERYRRLFTSMLEGFAVHEIILDSRGKPVDYRFLAVNPAFMKLTGLGADIVGKTVKEVLPQIETKWIETYGKVALTGEPVEFEDFGEDLAKHWYITAFQNAPMQFACIFQDVTERKRVAKERERLQDQLQQAMKMEAIGRLAGGIAHDFNNLLTGIIGNVGMALMDLADDDPLNDTLKEVNKAAERAAELTHQLLSFSRKQLIEPKVVNLDEIVANLNKMLVRLIGEDIRLITTQTDRLWAVKVDPGQFEQILVNLAINARDAMPNGGELTIETANVYLDDDYCKRHAAVKAGYYVMIAVSDTGHGMDEETQRHIFEPFFTTKEKGRGTGLGLATIYGAVKQAEGLIDVYSEYGHGSTFRIYLPRVEESVEPTETKLPEMSVPGGDETVLLAEDEEVVRSFTIKILSRLGYRVISASNGAEALETAEGHQGPIALLMTDVVMPGMNGRQLADQLLAIRPELKVLYTSGYTSSAITKKGVIDDGLEFIAKPYTLQSLAIKIRKILDS